jgi:hypothetical protein
MAVSTWWQVNRWGKEITPVEVISNTKCFITIRPDKESRWLHGSEYRQAIGKDYFPTFAEARTHLLDHFFNKMKNAEAEMSDAKRNWDKVFLMEPPKGSQ